MIYTRSNKEYLKKLKKEKLKKRFNLQFKNTAKLTLTICNDFKYFKGKGNKELIDICKGISGNTPYKNRVSEIPLYFFNFATSYNISYVK